jgi:hypothetical protein
LLINRHRILDDESLVVIRSVTANRVIPELPLAAGLGPGAAGTDCSERCPLHSVSDGLAEVPRRLLVALDNYLPVLGADVLHARILLHG